MVFHLFLLVLIIYTLFFFYVDVMNKINTNTFAEGMTNSGTFNQVEKRYCASYDSYVRNKVDVSAASPKVV